MIAPGVSRVPRATVASPRSLDGASRLAIRIAVGATPWTIRRLVVAEAVMLAGIGAAAGVLGAVVIARLGGEPLPGASTDDPAALGLAVGVLLAMSALAASLPVRAATRVDPIASLRA